MFFSHLGIKLKVANGATRFQNFTNYVLRWDLPFPFLCLVHSVIYFLNIIRNKLYISARFDF